MKLSQISVCDCTQNFYPLMINHSFQEISRLYDTLCEMGWKTPIIVKTFFLQTSNFQTPSAQDSIRTPHQKQTKQNKRNNNPGAGVDSSYGWGFKTREILFCLSTSGAQEPFIAGLLLLNVGWVWEWWLGLWFRSCHMYQTIFSSSFVLWTPSVWKPWKCLNTNTHYLFMCPVGSCSTTTPWCLK